MFNWWVVELAIPLTALGRLWDVSRTLNASRGCQDKQVQPQLELQVPIQLTIMRRNLTTSKVQQPYI